MHHSRVQNKDWDLRLRDQQMPVVNGCPFVFMQAISDGLMRPDACEGSKGNGYDDSSPPTTAKT